MYQDDKIDNMSVIFLKTNLESFSFLNFYMVDDGPATDVICNWISYIGASYKNLQELKMDYAETYFATDYARVLNTLNIATTNRKQINNFPINLNPLLSESIRSD